LPNGRYANENPVLWLQVALAMLIMILIATLSIRSFSGKQQPAPQQAAEQRHMKLRNAVPMTRFDSFDRRWWPIELPPPLAAADVEVRDSLPGDAQGPGQPVADGVPGVVVVAGRAPPPRHSRAQSTDVCARHGMHRVNYVKANGWKFWRCRK
jgi:hypothetical protein